MIVITAATLLAFLATISNAVPQGIRPGRSGDRRNMPQEARRWHSRSDEEHHSSHSDHDDHRHRHHPRYRDSHDSSHSHSDDHSHSHSHRGDRSHSHSHSDDHSHSHSHSDDHSHSHSHSDDHSHSHSHSDDRSHSHSHSDDHQCNKRHEPKWIHKGQGWDSKWESDKEWKQHEKKDSRHEKHRGVCHHDHRFFETSYVPHEHAEEACRKQGGYLAHIDDANFLEAVRAAYKCSGAFSESWIDSWNGDNYRHTCLVLSTGNAPGGGAINVPRECCKPRRALCMKGYRHKEHHHKPCHHGKDCDRHGHKEHHKPCHHGKDCDHKEHHKEHHHKDKDCKGKGCGCGCNCNCQNVFYRYDGNRLPIIGTGGEFQYYAVPGYVADDGALSIVNGALQVNSKVFTKTSPDISDNAKYLLLSTKTFTLPQKGSVSFSATVGAQVFGVNGQPFGAQVTSPENDPRLANGAFIVTDLSKSFLFGFSITNGTIYGGYRRSASTRSLYGNYAGFFQSGPLAKVMPGEPHRLSLVFNSDEQSLSYIIDGEERYKLRNLGSLVSDQFSGVNLGGTQESYWPANLTVGFGTTNFLNSYQTCYQTIPAPDGGRICQYPANEMGLVNLTAYSPQFNPRATTQLATFVADNTDVTRRLFGQGAIMTIRDLTVGYCKEPRIFDENRRD